MTHGEKAAAVIFFVVGIFCGGLVGLMLGHDLTIKELTNEKNHCIDNYRTHQEITNDR